MSTENTSNTENDLQENLQSAIANIHTIRHFNRKQSRPSRSKQKPGPRAKTVRLKFYLLPDGGDLPKFSKKDQLIERHQNLGYGFPSAYYENGNGKKVSLPLDLSDEEFKESVRSLYLKLSGKQFELYINSQSRQLSSVPFNLCHFKDINYQGIVIIKIQDDSALPVQLQSSRQPPSLRQQPALSHSPSTSHPPLSSQLPSTSHSLSSSQPPSTSHQPSSSQPLLSSQPSLSSLPSLSRQQPLSSPLPSSSQTSFSGQPPATSQPSTSTQPLSEHNPTSETSIHNSTVTLEDQNTVMNNQTFTSQDSWIATGTPSIQINPRHRLIMQQDVEFAESLAVDQEKEENRQVAHYQRNLERAERRRQREQRKADIERIQTDAVEAITNDRLNCPQTELINVVFVLPSQVEIRKNISRMTKSETLHLYLEGITEIGIAKLLFCGQVIGRDSEPLATHGINGNCRIIVEDIDLEDSFDDSDLECIEESEERNLLQLDDITELELRRERIREGLLPAVDVNICRENIVDDVITIYQQRPDIIHHQLNVTFKGEENALDLEGVTREMFSSFFMMVIMKFFIGHCHKIPRVDSRTLFNGTLQIIGKILSHAYILCNYIPQGISPIVFLLASSGYCSDELIMSSFLLFIPESDSKLVERLLSNSNWDGLHAEVVNFVATYGGFEVPKPTNIKQSVLDLAKLSMTVVPCVPISRIRIGMNCYHLLWNGITEAVLLQLFESRKPSASKMIKMIDYTCSEDPSLCALEERVKTYFEGYLRSLSDSQLLNFLKFWTSSDTLCIQKLYVAFNSTEGINRRPIANTCSATIQISRFYLSAEELKQDFNIYLEHSSSLMFDSV